MSLEQNPPRLTSVTIKDGIISLALLTICWGIRLDAHYDRCQKFAHLYNSTIIHLYNLSWEISCFPQNILCFSIVCRTWTMLAFATFCSTACADPNFSCGINAFIGFCNCLLYYIRNDRTCETSSSSQQSPTFPEYSACAVPVLSNSSKDCSLPCWAAFVMPVNTLALRSTVLVTLSSLGASNRCTSITISAWTSLRWLQILSQTCKIALVTFLTSCERELSIS